MSDANTVTWQGASGKTYVYGVYPLPPNFEAVAGNYIFSKLDHEGRWVPVYFGETSDLSERFDNHHATECIRRNGATHIQVHANSSKDARLAEEADLNAKYNTACNLAA